jgi:peptide-methionine (R)-S-oxide reductase
MMTAAAFAAARPRREQPALPITRAPFMETIDMNRPTDPPRVPSAPNAPNAPNAPSASAAQNPLDRPGNTYPVHKSDEAWRNELSGLEYEVTRHAATERPFTGRYWDHWERGVYDCVCCGTPLFESSTKFDAGCGWPSYFNPIDGEVIEEHTDRSHGMLRIEVRCKKCGAHLGHVFEDGPAPTGLRYCINSAALQFEPK